MITYLATECANPNQYTWPTAIMWSVIALASAAAVWAFFWATSKM